MSEKRIDRLRNMISAIGKEQIEYHKFFPNFADKLVEGFGRYLGDEKSVALTTDGEDFQFNIMYRHEGVKLKGGRYQIPIMIKLDNLNDSGFLLLRVWLFCTKNENVITISINNESPITIQEDKPEALYEEIYNYLRVCFSKKMWFEENASDYQATNIGFLKNE